MFVHPVRAIQRACLLLTLQCSMSQADSLVRGGSNGCGDLAGSCNERVCCCSSNGFLAQTPNSDGECEWNIGGGYEGPLFLIVVSVLPALISMCLVRRFSRSLTLRHAVDIPLK